MNPTAGEASLALAGSLRGLLWLGLVLLPLLVAQRVLHREIQGFFLILTRSQPVSLAVYSILFLPGVFLHEASHFLAAKLLGVRTGRFSIFPKAMADGRLRLGYVETAQTDIGRDALIGAAPLITGGLFVAWVALRQTGLSLNSQPLAGGLASLPIYLRMLPSSPDFWIWFYLVFVISSTMFPSPSDRRSWLPAALVAGALITVVLLSGAAPWLAENITPGLIRALQAVTTVYLVCLGVTLALLVPFWLLRVIVGRMVGVQIR